jgi:hypothetical protein
MNKITNIKYENGVFAIFERISGWIETFFRRTLPGGGHGKP